MCCNILKPRVSVLVFVVVIISALAAASVVAMPPTGEAVEKWKAEGVWEEKVANWKAFKEAGGSAPSENSPLIALRSNRSVALAGTSVDTINVVVILVDFADYRYDDTWYMGGSLGKVAAQPGQFRTLLFSRQDTDSVFNPTGSMTEFYLENSYDKVLIRGDVFGWYTMSKNYSWYVGADDGWTRGRTLAYDAVEAADADVNFALYTNGDNHVDGVIVVHAGPGAETYEYGIWSHEGTMNPSTRDGVYLSSYTMNPEEFFYGISTIGVFCHEYGHILGCPDLYDISGRGAGIGFWSLMGAGSWNGLPGGSRPAHFDAYCKTFCTGFVDAIWLEDNLSQAPLPQVEDSAVIYALGQVPGQATSDYWLVENRQRVGFDDGLPGAGLCIYHVDRYYHVQDDPARYYVGLEQADGRDDLGNNNNGGDGGDPWPGSTGNHNFHTFSVPNSLTNDDSVSQVGVWNISYSGPMMYADLDVTYSRPYVVFADKDSIEFDDAAPGGNGNGLPEAGETVEVFFEIKNKMRMVFSPTFRLSVDASDVDFIQNDVPLKSSVLNPLYDNGNDLPIIFSLPGDFESTNAIFTLTITMDSLMNSGDSVFVDTLTFEMTLGRTQVLVVDDDNGDLYENRYMTTLDSLRIPYEMWNKSSGSPSGADLAPFRTVIWFTGMDLGIGGTLTTDDIAALKEHLDDGGNLFLSSMTAPTQLQALDSVFMADYLHANLDSTNVYGFSFIGIDGNEVMDDASFSYYGNMPYPFHNILQPVGGGQAAFYLADDRGLGNYGIIGVTYNGNFRTVFDAFGFEFLSVGHEYHGFKHRDSLMRRVLNFFKGGAAVSVSDEDPQTLLPRSFTLQQNYPNPFNPTTTISYTVGDGTIKEPGRVRLTVYNMLGREVVTLVNRVQPPGTYTVTWDGTTGSGRKVASGIYLYRLESGEESSTRKMVLLK